MTGTPNLGLPLMASNDTQKEVLFNEAIIAFDIMAARVATSISTTPPSAPNTGDTYIVGAGASGGWLSQDGKIAFYFNGWQFLSPANKMKMWVTTPGGWYTFSADVWSADPVTAVDSLDDLSDVLFTALADGDFLKYDGVQHKWVNSSIAALTSLNSLSDVEAPTPTDGDLLAWSSALSRWINKAPDVQEVVDRLQDLTDVDWTSIAGGKVLAWDQSTQKAVWVDPETPEATQLSSLTDVDVAGAMANDALVFNGAVWGPSHLTYNYTFENMSDGPGTMEGHAGEFMIVDPTESFLTFISIADLLSTSTLYMQNLGDMDPLNSDDYVGRVPQVYKQGGLYRFKYSAMPVVPAYPVLQDGTQKTASMASLNFAGMTVTSNSNAVTVKPIPLEWQAEDQDVTGPPVTAINFRGAGVGVTNVEGVLEVEVAGANTGAGGSYDLSVFYPGQLVEPNQEVMYFPVARNFRILSNFTGSVGRAKTPPSADCVFNVMKNGTSVGAITAKNDGSFVFATGTGGVINFAIGDVLEVLGPAVPDTTIANFSLNLVGVKT